MNIRYIAYKHRKLIAYIAVPLVSLAFKEVVAHAVSPIYSVTTQWLEVDEVHTKPHLGLDLAMPIGTPIDSAIDGVVTEVRHAGDRSYGTSVHIQNKNGDVLLYGHLSEAKVEVGQEVHVGDTVALSGNSGFSTGPHLHVSYYVEGKQVNPIRVLMRAAIGRNDN